MATKSYVMKVDSKIQPEAVAGTRVYDIKGYDYGTAGDDSRVTGVEHVSVTMKPDGDYPFFTVPKRDLEQVSE